MFLVKMFKILLEMDNIKEKRIEQKTDMRQKDVGQIRIGIK